jgi:FKBP-type peptidyl-prolyl cis-trans isomerase FkpA
MYISKFIKGGTLLLLFILPFLFSCKKTTVDQAAIDHAAILKYIADKGLVADSLSSGLYYVIADSGTGNSPNTSSYITVNYKGYYTNDVIFDQTTGTTASFILGKVIEGWKQGIPLIKKGGKIKLLVPSALGYGTAGLGSVPPNSVLIFDVELIDFI